MQPFSAPIPYLSTLPSARAGRTRRCGIHSPPTGDRPRPLMPPTAFARLGSGHRLRPVVRRRSTERSGRPTAGSEHGDRGQRAAVPDAGAPAWSETSQVRRIARDGGDVRPGRSSTRTSMSRYQGALGVRMTDVICGRYWRLCGFAPDPRTYRGVRSPAKHGLVPPGPKAGRLQLLRRICYGHR